MKENGPLSDIILSIDELAKRGRISRSRAFAAWFAINFFSLDEDEALEAAAVDGGNDQGIDLVFTDDTAEEIIILQAYCPENINKNTPKNKWDAVISSIPFFKETSFLVKSGRKDLADLINDIKDKNKDYKFVFGLIYLGLKSQEISDSVSAHQYKYDDEDHGYFYLSQEDIISKYRALISSESGIAEDVLTFSGGYIQDDGDYGRALIGSVNAEELQRLYRKYNDEIFSGNIRLFLGVRKGGINEQIIKTAKEDPGIFWALNNGITIIADTAEKIDNKDEKCSFTLRRFSIINGCQTTSSLVQAKATSKAKVLTRVISAKTSVKSDIIRYNNSQNSVRIWSVRSADITQKTLRDKFNTVGIIYAPRLAGARKKKDENIIELDRVTQYLASFRQEYLIISISNKGELFDQPYQKIFYKNIKATEVYLAWLVGISSDSERQKLLDELSSDLNSGLLSVASTYWISFCAYKLIEKFSNFNSPHITLEVMVSPEFKAALNKYTSKATSMFYDAAVDAYDSETYGSFKSTLRSSKFLQKIDSKLNLRTAKIYKRSLPDLAVAARSMKKK